MAAPLGLAIVLLGGVTAAPADDPRCRSATSERYIKVDDVKARLDRGKPVVLIDVRPKEQYEAIHIRGALSIPLRELPGRLGEVPRSEVLVLY